jgi:hypothetical protein
MENASSKISSSKLVIPIILFLTIISCATPNLNAQPTTSPQTTDSILTSLTEPLDGEAYPINAELSIRGEVISVSPVIHMELWVNGELYEEYTPHEQNPGGLIHYWKWSPEDTGDHTLLMRADNEHGQSNFSNSITIRGIPDPGFVLLTTANKGDTVALVAERYHVSVDQIQRANFTSPNRDQLLAGEEISIHFNTPVSFTTVPQSVKGLMKFKSWPREKPSISFLRASVPPAPELSVSSQGCDATLVINDLSSNEQGLHIYRLTPGSVSFSKIATLGAHSGSNPLSFTDRHLYGLYHYYVTSFNTEGEAKSNLVSLNISKSSCVGMPVYITDLVSFPGGIEDYYLYASIDSGKAQRIPAKDFIYLKTSQNHDIGSILASLAPSIAGKFSVRGEVWGMANGNATLIGLFDRSFTSGESPIRFETGLFQNLFSTTLEVRGVFDVNIDGYPWQKEKGMAYGTEVFRYSSNTGADYGLWQVSSVPFQPDTSFNPACLLLTGKANGKGTPDEPFVFGIDFSQIKPKVENVHLSPFDNFIDQSPLFLSPFSPEKMDISTQQVVGSPKWGVSQMGLEKGPIPVPFDPCSQNMSSDGKTTYYVRLIPMKASQVSGVSSNTVKVIFNPEGQIKFTIPSPPVLPEVPYYDVRLLNFTGVHVPNYQYEYCVEVVENKIPPGSLNPWANVKPGDKICPKVFKGGNEDDLLNIIEDAINYISGLYNKLSDWATDLVDKLNPLCIQAKLGSSALKVGEKEVKDACHFIAAAAVTAAKTYVGLPPSLPNYDQLTELGKKNMVDLAAQELENSGVPCPDECKDVIRKGIDYSIEQIKANMNNSSCIGEQEAHENGIEPLCTPPGIITKPDPRGQPAPAVVEVQVTRRPNSTGPSFPEPSSCNVNINVSATNTSHFGESFVSGAGFHWNGAEIQGNLLSGMGAFPELQPGETIKYPIILTPSSFWLTGHKEFVKKGWKPEHYDDWNILYQGAMATINAGGTCKFELPEGIGFSNASVSGDTMKVGPLGNAWAQTCHPYNCP